MFNPQKSLTILTYLVTILWLKCIDMDLNFTDDIDQQHREMCDIERNVRNMRNDIIKLNTLLHKEKNMGDSLEQGNALLENDFVSKLKVQQLNNNHNNDDVG